MSGGSMDHLYARIIDGAASFVPNTPERRALGSHMIKLAEALRAIEWNDSGDGADDEAELIRACLCESEMLETIVLDAQIALKGLQEELDRGSS